MPLERKAKGDPLRLCSLSESAAALENLGRPSLARLLELSKLHSRMAVRIWDLTSASKWQHDVGAQPLDMWLDIAEWLLTLAI